jgi:hypothetical protein
MDGFGGDSLVLAVVDLSEKRRDLSLREARDLGRAPRAAQGTRVHDVELETGQPGAKRCGVLFALSCERQVGAAGVAAADGPLGFAVAGEVDLDRQAGLPIISGRPERSERLALSITAPARTRCPGRMQTSPTTA